MKQYIDLVKHVLATGTRKENRTGIDTLSTFNHNYEIDLRDGFPLLTTKAVSWKNIVVELLWFLSGQTDIGILKRHGCKFWDAWADPETGKVPSAYGNLWRHFPVHGIVNSSDHNIDGDDHCDLREACAEIAHTQAEKYSERARKLEGATGGLSTLDLREACGAAVASREIRDAIRRRGDT